MSLQSGQTKLNAAHKDLLAAWASIRPSWRDAVARHFEDEYIAPLEQKVRKTTTVMQGMQDLLQRAKNDCS